MEVFNINYRRIKLETLKATAEYQEWGWIMFFTISGTTTFSILSFWALWGQIKKMWSSRSGESLYISWFSYSLFFFIALTIYGFHINSIATVFSASISAILNAFMVIGLLKFKKWANLEKIQIFIFLQCPF